VNSVINIDGIDFIICMGIYLVVSSVTWIIQNLQMF
jgi:hypothetical protein